MKWEQKKHQTMQVLTASGDATTTPRGTSALTIGAPMAALRVVHRSVNRYGRNSTPRIAERFNGNALLGCCRREKRGTNTNCRAYGGRCGSLLKMSCGKAAYSPLMRFIAV
jgi:hypothetical protein